MTDFNLFDRIYGNFANNLALSVSQNEKNAEFFLFYALAIMIGYFSGGLLFAYYIPKVIKHVDITELSEDHNPGTFNAFKYGGFWCGIFALILELFKGFAPVFAASRFVDPNGVLFVPVLLAPVLGHAYSPFFGLKKEKLHPFGIPYSPRILLDVTKERAKETLSLDQSKKTVLLIGGSMGAGNLLSLTDAFAADERTSATQTVIICGNNRALRYKILKKYRHDKRFKILGHTDKMPLFMKAADVIYTKPGGLTSTETAASRTPLVITYPIPGCETANKEFFLERGMAVSANKPAELVNAGFELISSPEKTAAMINAQKENVSEKATENAVNFILSLIEKRKN